MRRSTWPAFLFLGSLFASSLAAQPEEPRVFIAGIWPDRILFFDQTTDEFTESLRLRHGAVTGRSSFTPDKNRLFVITDRMESVEILDPIRAEVVDEFKLSTPARRVRLFGVYPNRDGTMAYLTVSAVELGVDRFIRDESVDIVAYDVTAKQIVKEFTLPRETSRSFRPAIHVAPDGESFYIISSDIVRIDADTLEVLDRLALSKPLLAGFGPFRGLSLTQTEPGTFYGIYRTKDPIQEKRLFGVAKLDLYDMKVSTFELGPELELGRFALSPDGKRGYAGLTDMVVIDMVKERVILKKEGFERGRTNNSMIVSHDGTKLYISGVGDTVYIYDAATLEPIKTVFAGGDFMLPPIELPNPTTSGGSRP